jgi:hypothetical protein
MKCMKAGLPVAGGQQIAGFIPKDGELLVWAFPKVNHYRSGQQAQCVSGSRGFSVRIMRGLWWREGNYRGRRESRAAMFPHGEGLLILTNQGFSFLGASGSTRIPFNRIINIVPCRDGVQVHTDYARNATLRVQQPCGRKRRGLASSSSIHWRRQQRLD